MLGDLLDQVHWDTLVLVTLDETEEVFSEDLENHADMCSVGTFVPEMIEKGDDVGTTGMGLGGRWRRIWVGRGGLDRWCGRGDEPLEQLYFVEGGFCVSWGGLDDLEGYVTVKSLRYMRLLLKRGIFE